MMRSKVFISYRREDSAPWAGRLYERLSRSIDKEDIFIDVDSIAPGGDFPKILDDRVGACDVFLCVIGKNWTSAKNDRNQRRLDDPNDFVRIEVESALSRGISVIPILVDGATMPPADELPESIRPLARRNAVALSHSRFGADSQIIVDAAMHSPSGQTKKERASVPTRRPDKIFAEVILTLTAMAAPVFPAILLREEVKWEGSRTTLTGFLVITALVALQSAIILSRPWYRHPLISIAAAGVIAFWIAVGSDFVLDIVWQRFDYFQKLTGIRRVEFWFLGRVPIFAVAWPFLSYLFLRRAVKNRIAGIAI